MTEWSFRERGREYRVSEHAGTVEHVQTIARTTMHGSNQSAGFYIPATMRLDARTIVTQRVFMDDGQGSKWSFDCEDNIPIRPGARLLLRYLSAGSVPADVAYIDDQESNWQVVRPNPIGRLVRPRWITFWAGLATLLIGLFVFINYSNAEVRSRQVTPQSAPSYFTCQPDKHDFYGYPVYGPVGRACNRVVEAASQALPTAFVGLWVTWYLRRRSLRRRLHQRLAQGRGPDASLCASFGVDHRECHR